MRKSLKFSPEVVERAVRMVFDAKDQYPSQWAAIESIAGKVGCTGETLRKWVRQGERDSGKSGSGLFADWGFHIRLLEAAVSDQSIHGASNGSADRRNLFLFNNL